MFRPKKILFIAFATAWLLSTGLMLFAQNKAKKLYRPHPITIGFQTGKTSAAENLYATPHKKTVWVPNKRFTVKAAINKHFNVETGINFSQAPFNNINTIRNPGLLKNQAVSVPLSFQYYPLPHHCRMQPYCGVGVQHGFNPNITLPPQTTENTVNADQQSGTKYISILFTQGVTYEINTKIQINQSFHFIPESNLKSFDLGIGYTIN